MTTASVERSITDQAVQRRVIIIGGGFAGVAVAKSLKGINAEVVLIDKQNHHVFQPLLYQVATASLSPANISQPIRTVLPRSAGCQVVLADVKSIDPDRQRVFVDGGSVPYDYLVIAAGASHDYFGNDDWESIAPGLKTLADATEIRRRVLLAFESAEHEADEESRSAALTFAVVGAGPTGVELAGAIKSIASKTLPSEYRNIDTKTARVLLFEGGPCVLPGFPEKLSQRAMQDLKRLGVEVRINSRVEDVTSDGVTVNDTLIPAQNVFWAAGVKASPLNTAFKSHCDRAGRVRVHSDLSVPGYSNVFVVGDAAAFVPVGDTSPLPGVAQVAMQMGRYSGQVIREELTRGESKRRKTEFKYKDKGSMAIIGKNRAVAFVGGFQFTGFIAWVLWAVVHIAFLVGFRNRLRVMFNWAIQWLLDSHDARLIVGENTLRIVQPAGEGVEVDPD